MTSLNWQRTVEQIALRNRRYRILGFTSVASDAGVSLISRLTAKALSESGCRTLLVDLSQAVLAEGNAKAGTMSNIAGAITNSANGFDILSFSGDDGRKIPRMVDLRDFLRTEVAGYDNVVLDMPAVLDNDGEKLSAVSISAICDAMLLVCALGKDSRVEIDEVVNLIKGGGTQLVGVVSNEGFNTDTVYAALRRWSRIFKRRSPTAEPSGSTA